MLTERRHLTAAISLAAMALLLTASAPARAQPAAPPEPAGRVGAGLPPDVLAQQERSGRAHVRTGVALFSTGLGLSAIGTGLFFIGDMDWGGIIGGGCLVGAGGLLVLSGVPTWITGAVRRSLARAGNPPELRRRWARAGMITFLSGLGVAAVGAVTLGLSTTSLANGEGSLFISGVTLLPLGVVISLVVGVPMWVEPGREVWQQAATETPGALAPRADVRDPFADRWTFRRLGPSLPPAFLVNAPVLTF